MFKRVIVYFFATSKILRIVENTNILRDYEGAFNRGLLVGARGRK
jgi:hypothetical protein